MNQLYIQVSQRTAMAASQVKAVLQLFEAGATVPFIARYRKEATGNLDEVAIAQIKETAKEVEEMEKRRQFILDTIKQQDKLTPDLEKSIREANSMTLLEDLYLPYKQKKKTRAQVARERGLQGLADFLLKQTAADPEHEAEKYFSDELGVSDHQAALQGACDILSEQFSEDLQLRSVVRQQFNRSGMLISKVARGKKDQAEKYRDYLDWSEPLTKAPSHRILAIFRGENEGLLSVKLEPNPEEVMEMLARRVIKGRNRCADYVTQALEDSYKRLLQPSIETEFRQGLKERADREAVRVFAENVKQLLLESPLGQKNVLAIDPGFRTGCKVVCLNRQGDLLHNETIYPHSGHREALEAENKIEHKIQAYKIEAIAIGNGTAGRETEAFVKKIRAARDLPIIMVNESGASVYSASAVAREEFPDYDVTVRGAVSIGRRLMDPLAELVKIDPKSIGVGQYQHDVNQAMLQDALQQVVSSAVNAVGVEVNTASKQLLSCVSGLGPALAENIVRHRKENGPFKSRKELKKVPRMGDKTFEQCAGFLRIREAEYPLDRSAVHPESYAIVEKMAKDLGCSLAELVSNKALQKQIDLNKYTSATVGLPTLKDILDELDKPGRDPRAQFQMVQFAGGINDMQQLAVGMVLTGIVTNITSFGCFVDVGVHQDGLVHISELANRFVKDPNEVVKLRQAVQVKVIDLDLARKRIQLSIKQV